MPFKIHLLIVSVIIITVYGLHTLISSPPPPPTIAHVSDYNISIVRASWGLNCLNLKFTEDPNDSYQATASTNKLRENNILTAVSNICNGKDQCDISTDMLGEDPQPACMGKLLEVEYRCFSFDRIWKAKSTSGIINLKCEKPPES